MVLIAEALTPEFGKRFWEFIQDGGYEHRAKSNGSPQFFRFDKPQNADYPYMIELFSKTSTVIEDVEHGCIPLHLGDEISSLPAILLTSTYYQLLLTGKTVIKLTARHRMLFSCGNLDFSYTLLGFAFDVLLVLPESIGG